MNLINCRIMMNIVPKLLRRFHNSKYFYSTTTAPKSNQFLERLNNRSLLEVSGTEVSTLLQGLITNDMRHLEDEETGNNNNSTSRAMYCAFLNTKGRVLYDSIIYSTYKNNESYLIECDSNAIESLFKHLKMYKLRRKIDININNNLLVWCAYGNDLENNIEQNNNLIIVKDPRLKDLGYRIISNKDKDIVKLLNIKLGEDYKDIRYKLGIGEGVDEIPVGNCFPLEMNFDYLHGVSFHKGCYIGQELTARTHHTGVVRKRLMPILLPSSVKDKIEIGTIITDPNGKNVGKLRNYNNDNGYGIALLRIADVLKNPDNLCINNNVLIKTYKPYWWPTELTKEKPSV